MKLKNFNNNYKNVKDSDYFQKISNDYDMIISLIEFYNIREKVLVNLMCKNILRSNKKNLFNFYIWIDEDDKHNSLVCNAGKYYLFLDSCSTFFERYPTQKIVSWKAQDNLFKPMETIAMLSFLQTDDYNCCSFTFALLEIIIKLYLKYKDLEIMMDYLFLFFSHNHQGTFHSESVHILTKEEPSFFDRIYLFLLPREILELAESKQMLDILKNALIENNNKYDALMVEEIIENIEKNGYAIKLYRQKHLEYLMSEKNEKY